MAKNVRVPQTKSSAQTQRASGSRRSSYFNELRNDPTIRDEVKRGAISSAFDLASAYTENKIDQRQQEKQLKKEYAVQDQSLRREAQRLSDEAQVNANARGITESSMPFVTADALRQGRSELATQYGVKDPYKKSSRKKFKGLFYFGNK